MYNSWLFLFLSTVIVISIGLLSYSTYQLLQLKKLQPTNHNLTWLIIVSCALIFVSIYLFVKTFTQPLEATQFITVCIFILATLCLWFATQAGKNIAVDLSKAEALERYFATHDDLTGLPNLSFFNQQLESVLCDAEYDESDVALLLIDLNRFKLINETLGYFAGDVMLQEISQRIRGTLRNTDLIARLGGDEFAVLINPVIAQGHIHTIANNIIKAIEEPLAVEGKPTDVGVSVGVAMYPKHAKSGLELIEKARNAMLSAENQGATVLLYDHEIQNDHAEDIQIIGMLHRAIQTEQLKILFQPQYSLKDLNISSVEALIRWQHPNYGMLDPRHFIPYAERAGLIYEINLWLLKKIVLLLSDWKEKSIDLPIAMNIAAKGFINKEFQQELKTYTKNQPWVASRIKIELTETSIIENERIIVDAMQDYKKAGVRFSLDDYGTKHASLEYLKKLPFDDLKIDQSFMVNAASDKESQTIIRHAKEIAQQLGISTTAEGIENKEILDVANQNGIDFGQGFHFMQAVTESEIEEYIKPNNS